MSAIISPCGRYRYRLDRTVAEKGPVYAFFGINPSTADANTDDATVRKWAGFVKRWGGSKFIVGNVFAYRATNVNEVGATYDPHGPDIGDHITEIIQEADFLVPCWGSTSKAPPHLRDFFDTLMDALASSGKPVRCFGLTKAGDPKHPLMLGYDTPLVPIDAVDLGADEHDPCPECGNHLLAQLGGGVKCSSCDYWFCF